MDKKAKKKIDVLHKKLQQIRLKLSGARQQDDEPGEVSRLEAEIAQIEADIQKLRAS